MRKFAMCLLLLSGWKVLAQEVTPRRWSHVPVGSHFVGTGVAYTEADIFFDPVLQTEDVTMEMYTVPLGYTYSFPLMGKSARVEVTQVYQDVEWKGLLRGEPATVKRQGFGDANFRLAVDLYGAPPLKGKEFVDYRRDHPVETLVGGGLVVTAPTGEYFSDKLLNLGNNRWVIRPQLGAVHTRNRWTFELTGAVWFYTDNDDFWQDTKREQDPLLSWQGHVIYTYRPGCWFAFSGAHGSGAENTIDGVAKEDDAENIFWALSTGLPIDRKTGLKLSWIHSETKTSKGADTDSVLLVLARMF